MSSADLSRAALELPAEDRLELARRLVESVVAPAALNEAVAEGIRRAQGGKKMPPWVFFFPPMGARQ